MKAIAWSRKHLTPWSNLVMLIFASVFGYFAITEDKSCHSKDKLAWRTPYSDTVDVSHQFMMVNITGMVLLLVSVLLHYLESTDDDMFDQM